MSEMLDRVAAAIRESEAYWWNRDDEPKDGLAETLARAAIKAMREPTEEMIERAIGVKGDHGWRTMIDEALKH